MNHNIFLTLFSTINVARIAFFVGANTHFNVTRVITNHGWMLSDSCELDLVTTAPEAYEPAAKEYYRTYGERFPTNKVGHVVSLWAYLRNNSPDIVVPATRPVLYGSLVFPLSLSDEFEYIYRQSGEIFNYYKSLNGWKKVLCYGTRNIGGNLPLSAAERYIALGPNGKKSLIKKGVDPTKITILPPTISEDRFSINKDEIPEPLERLERDIVLFLGRRTRMKGICVMEEAIPAVLDQREDLQFVFVGGGNRYPQVSDSVRDHITVLDAVPPSVVPSILSVANLLVLPSLSEGLPRVLLESLYMETPVLANHIGDVPQVTDNTYHSTEGLIQRLIDYERLPLDSVDPFTRSSAKEKYVEFFAQGTK